MTSETPNPKTRKQGEPPRWFMPLVFLGAILGGGLLALIWAAK